MKYSKKVIKVTFISCLPSWSQKSNPIWLVCSRSI